MTDERSHTRLHLGTDHAGYTLAGFLIRRLEDDGVEVIDHSADEFDPDDDYPAPCIAAAEAVVADPGSLGLVLGGSGNGEQMAANLVLGSERPSSGTSRRRSLPVRTTTPTSWP
jgi:ribose 5-phosphate isomerase B